MAAARFAVITPGGDDELRRAAPHYLEAIESPQLPWSECRPTTRSLGSAASALRTRVGGGTSVVPFCRCAPDLGTVECVTEL